MNIFFFLKFFGRNAVQTTISHNLGRISPTGWVSLANDFDAAVTACKGQSKGDLAAAITSVLFEIK